MMAYRKTFKAAVLFLVLMVSSGAVADDFSPAPFRGQPGSMYMEWSYDSDAPSNGIGDRWDGAEGNFFVPHPEKEDPGDWQGEWEEWGYEFINGVPYDPCVPDYSYTGVYGNQMWAMGSGYEDPQDPCDWIDTASIWMPTFVGRTGVMADFVYGWWDMYNFIHNQPAKDMWVQLTYFNAEAPGTPVPVAYLDDDPCEGYWMGMGHNAGELEPYGRWEGLTDPCDPCSFVYCEIPLAEWDCPGDPLETWMEQLEGWFEGEIVSTAVMGDGWIQQVFAVTAYPNPTFEWFELGFVTPIAIAQIIIETLCYTEQHDLDPSSTVGGSVTDPGEAGPYTYDCGTVVNLVATPAVGYYFVNWTGDTAGIANVNSATTTVTMQADYAIVANFSNQYDLDPSSTVGGSVTDPGEAGPYTYNYDTVVNLVATPAVGYYFVNWIGDTAGIANVNSATTTVTMQADYTLVANFASDADVIYVDASVTGGANNGTSWTDAYLYLQNALNDPALAYGYSILVAEGSYRPDEDTNDPCGTGDRGATFGLISGVAIYGGFPTGGGVMEDRDPNRYETILSGDLLENDGPDFANNGENSYHVVRVSGITDPNTTLDGFTITAGNADGSSSYSRGGGMYNDESSPTVTNCTFTVNSAGRGGGMHNYLDSSPTLTNCIFAGNSVDSGGGMYNWFNSSPTVTNCTFSGNSADYHGGGMSNDNGSWPTVTNCTFSGNSASGDGGGMFNWNNTSPTVTNCIFTGNSARSGGGMYSDESSPTLTNCIFTGNSADSGGGMRNQFNSSPIVTNCTFTGNSASGVNAKGGGMGNSFSSSPTVTNCTFTGNSADYGGGGMYNYSTSNTTITNCIMWGDSAGALGDEIYNYSSTPVISYSDIAGCGGSGAWDSSFGTDGGGNINTDPMFKDADGADDIAGTEDDNLQLAYESPCIDAADSNSVPADYADLDEDGDTAEQTPLDLAGNNRFFEVPTVADTGTGTLPIVDMGAYEGYEFCGSEVYPYRPGDANQDCRFDLADIALIALQWLDYYGPE